MSGENPSADFNRDRAELFEALGHPTRIKILELLSGSPLGFSDMKKKLEVESSGLLQFHLGKLHGLVKITEGNYILTDEGKDALRVMIEPMKGRTKSLISISPLKALLIILAILLVASLAYNASLNQNLSNLNNMYQDFGNNYTALLQNYTRLQGVYDQLITNSTIFQNVLEALSTTEPIPITPPVSKFQAVLIAFGEGRLNEHWTPNSTLSAKLVYIKYGAIVGSFAGEAWGVTILHEVNEPVSNYSSVTIDGTTFYYAWSISIERPVTGEGATIFMLFPKYIDASTGKLIM